MVKVGGGIDLQLRVTHFGLSNFPQCGPAMKPHLLEGHTPRRCLHVQTKTLHEYVQTILSTVIHIIWPHLCAAYVMVGTVLQQVKNC